MPDPLDSDIRRKAFNKFKGVLNGSEAAIPDGEVVQQASGTLTARFTASLIPANSRVVDLTAGLGVNTLWFSKKASHVTAIELNPHRAEVLEENLRNAGIRNVDVVAANCLEWLSDNTISPQDATKAFDIAYVDPSRRSDSGKRVFLFDDCSPSLSAVINLFQGRTSRLLVKASPLLDISSIFKEFPQTTTIYVLESHNEVKELLIDMDLSLDPSSQPEAATIPRTVKCVMLPEPVAESSALPEPGAESSALPEPGAESSALSETGAESSALSETGVESAALSETGAESAALSETGAERKALSDGGTAIVWEFPFDESSEPTPVFYLKSSEEVHPGCYVYEPSPSIMKAAGFNRLQSYFPELKKFSPNTHLFMGNELFADFPGKIFRVDALLRSSDLKKMKGSRASVISRNHPAKASELEARYRLKSSDTTYLIAATIGSSKLILSASRLP
ncbi:MAG: RsmD family RNA methyltransferase [Muribaculaceae bacterium]|nr:RsmD family RNA methyltransferase [Muribaculaceae bacterium]